MLFKIIFPIVLQLLGIGVIIMEFFIPSGGLLSVLSLGLLVYSTYLVFTDISFNAGLAVVLADLIIVPIVVIYGIKVIVQSRVSLKSELSSKDGVVSQAEDLILHEGKSGTTVSPLRPSGIALINGQRVDVVTTGEFIPKGVNVKVISVTGNQVIVRAEDTHK